ncbi:MAG: uncharacterized beta-barrel protein YwiB (DUF1934 family) [Bacillariaceae sp.]|jgi:uncharacterized beta-barrel protein YwiB (DUF1934 family)
MYTIYNNIIHEEFNPIQSKINISHTNRHGTGTIILWYYYNKNTIQYNTYRETLISSSNCTILKMVYYIITVQ